MNGSQWQKFPEREEFFTLSARFFSLGIKTRWHGPPPVHVAMTDDGMILFLTENRPKI
jgi:hypothetical protein